MTVGDEAPQDAEAQAARAAAEARRRRILEQKDQRMGVVIGGGGNTSDTNASRGQAAMMSRRRRMYHQKKQVKEEDTEDVVTKESSAKEKSIKESASSSTVSASSAEEQPRKYQGVARMRRKMLKERQAAQAAAKEEEPSEEIDTTIVPPIASTTPAVPLAYVILQLSAILLLFGAGLQVGFQHAPHEVVTVHRELSLQQHGIGILTTSSSKPMDIQTLLSFASHNDPPPAVELESEFEDTPPKQVEVPESEFEDMSGEKANQEETVDSESYGDKTLDTLEDSSNKNEQAAAEEEADSSDGETLDTDAVSKAGDPPLIETEFVPPKVEKNLDPLFQVDLDELTKGPGLFLMAARFAVRVHRINLLLFYETPKRVATTLWQLPSLLLQTPPVFCLLALTIRQATQRLGGGNEIVEKKKQSKDLLAMAKGMVIQFLTGMFPTVVSLYKVWTNLRADMYILLCGFFVGVAWMHTMHHVVIHDDEEDTLLSDGGDEL